MEPLLVAAAWLVFAAIVPSFRSEPELSNLVALILIWVTAFASHFLQA